MSTSSHLDLYRAYQQVRAALQKEEFHIPSEFFAWLNERIEDLEIDIHQILADRQKIAVIWSVSDVQEVRPDLTEDQCWDVLQAVQDNHDANHGICCETLRVQAEILFGPESQQKGDFA